jgi:aminoglycoside 3-N-acetyltransferase I
MHASVLIRRLNSADLGLLRALNSIFGDAFDEQETYTKSPPSDAYLSDLLSKEHIVVLVALVGGRAVGGLVAYELDKFESQRRELYIYDLAVALHYRRRGIATSLIQALREIAVQRDAWVIFVQADYGDDAAVALYERLGVRDDVMHFDITGQIARLETGRT